MKSIVLAGMLALGFVAGVLAPIASVTLTEDSAVAGPGGGNGGGGGGKGD